MKVFELIEILTQYNPEREVSTMMFYHSDGLLTKSDLKVITLTDVMAYFVDCDMCEEARGLHAGDLAIVPEAMIEDFEDWYKEWREKYEIDYEKDESIERSTT